MLSLQSISHNIEDVRFSIRKKGGGEEGKGGVACGRIFRDRTVYKTGAYVRTRSRLENRFDNRVSSNSPYIHIVSALPLFLQSVLLTKSFVVISISLSIHFHFVHPKFH